MHILGSITMLITILIALIATMVYATLRAMGLEVDIAIVLNFTYRALTRGYALGQEQ